MPPGLVTGAGLCPAHPVFGLCEGLLDGVEVRGVWRQEPEACAGGHDGLADCLGLVTSQIVHAAAVDQVGMVFLVEIGDGWSATGYLDHLRREQCGSLDQIAIKWNRSTIPFNRVNLI